MNLTSILRRAAALSRLAVVAACNTFGSEQEQLPQGVSANQDA